MIELQSCGSCSGFVPDRHATCPHCEAAVAARRPGGAIRLLAQLLGGGAFAVTMMACYGGPPPHMHPGERNACPPGETDQDGDGVCTPNDCDDADPGVTACDPEPLGEDPADG
jgi:hypothetical protein